LINEQKTLKAKNRADSKQRVRMQKEIDDKTAENKTIMENHMQDAKSRIVLNNSIKLQTSKVEMGMRKIASKVETLQKQCANMTQAAIGLTTIPQNQGDVVRTLNAWMVDSLDELSKMCM
jgi:hypothetical protein